MTNEEHIEQLKKLRSFHNGSYGRSINKAIKALEQEPCKVSEYDKDHIWYKGHQYISLRRFLEVKAEQEQSTDAVSRQAVLEMAYDMSEIDGEHFTEPWMVVDVEDIQKLPPAIPTRPKGQWICIDDYHIGKFKCSVCQTEGFPNTVMYEPIWNYCPNCGADMREGEV